MQGYNRLVRFGSSATMAFGIAALGCGSASEYAESEALGETQSAVTLGQSVVCFPQLPTPPGYPQRVCRGFGGSPPNGQPINFICDCYPADVTTTDLLPFKVVTILRAPPGNMSAVSYASGSTVGIVDQIVRTTQSGPSWSVSAGAVDAETKWSLGKISGSQKLMQTTNTDTVSLTNTRNSVDHTQDTFYVWLNPRLNGRHSGITAQVSASLTAASQMRSPTGDLISSLGPDGQPLMQIVAITAHALANPSARTPAQQGFFGHLTPEHIAHILALDDFHSIPGFNPAHHPETFRFVERRALAGPAPGETVVPGSGRTIQYDSSNDTIDGDVDHKEVSVRAGPKFDFLGLEFESKIGYEWAWDYTDTRIDIQGTQKAANLVLQTNTPCVHAWVDMYLDLTFGSWVAVPAFTHYSCGTYDTSTVCNVGGVNMHCCPSGKAMVGIHHQRNTFKCAPVEGLSGPVTLDTGTVRNNMHVCPAGQLMVGFHGDRNLLACQSAPGITSERVDANSADGFPMHVCDSTFATSAMAGIHLDQNLLTCAATPNVF